MSSESYPQPKVLSLLTRKSPVFLQVFLARLDLHTYRRPFAAASHGDMRLSPVTVHHVPVALKASPHCLLLKTICNAGVCQLPDLIHQSPSARDAVGRFAQALSCSPGPACKWMLPSKNGCGNKLIIGKTGGKNILLWAVSLKEFVWRAVNGSILHNIG